MPTSHDPHIADTTAADAAVDAANGVHTVPLWANIDDASLCIGRSSKESMKAEVVAAEGRGKAEAEKAALQSTLDAALAQSQAQQGSLQATIQRLEADAKDYKVTCLIACLSSLAESAQRREFVVQ